MKSKLIPILSIIVLLASNITAQSVYQKELPYNGLNGPIDSVEVSYHSFVDDSEVVFHKQMEGRKMSWAKEKSLRIFDNNGYTTSFTEFRLDPELVLKSKIIYQRDDESLAYEWNNTEYKDTMVVKYHSVLLERKDNTEEWKLEMFVDSALVETSINLIKVNNDSWTNTIFDKDKSIVYLYYEQVFDEKGRVVSSLDFEDVDGAAHMQQTYAYDGDDYCLLTKITDNMDGEPTTSERKEGDCVRDEFGNVVSKTIFINDKPAYKEISKIYYRYYFPN